MSDAAVSLEKAAEALAATAREGAKVIDLTAMEELKNSRDATVEPSNTVEPEIVIDYPGPAVTTGTVEDTTAEDHMPKTRYQRSTGVPLRERIKIARMSG
jgi:hypothetical protein